MKENKIRSIILVIIAIATLALIVGAATYAFFATEKDLDNGIVNANVGTAASMYSFSATSNNNIEINILFNDMSQANVSANVVKMDNATMDVSLASPSEGMLTRCTYDIVWVWDSDENNKYIAPDVSLPYIDEQTVLNAMGITKEQYDAQKNMMNQQYGPGAFENYLVEMLVSNGYEVDLYNYEFSVEVDGSDETDLSKLPKNGNKVVLQKGAIASNSTTPTTKTYTVTASVYNLPVDQKNLFDKSFEAHITIDNLYCNIIDVSNAKELVAYIKEDVYTADGENGLYLHDGEGSYTNADLEIGDNSYRYAGANPNNYVCFAGDDCSDENNLYRIIGVIDNKVKLIKYTDINSSSTLAWASNDVNIWEGSTLERYLNSQDEGYLYKLETKADLIDEITWSVGGFEDSNIDTQNAKGIYKLEINPTNKTTYTGKIGLMYVHEYMYAADPTYWSKVGYNYLTKDDYRLSQGNDWMLLTSLVDWTISRNSASNNGAFDVYGDAGVDYNNYVSNVNFMVHPSFSLISRVTITNMNADGVGSKDTPMVIN